MAHNIPAIIPPASIPSLTSLFGTW